MDRIRSLWPPLSAAVIYGLIPLMLIAAFCALLAALFWRKRDVTGVAAIFALIGASLGLLLGDSREPAVGAVLPALIALIGGLAVYVVPREPAVRMMVARDKDKADQPAFIRAFVGAAVASLVVAAVLGTNFGAMVRRGAEEQDRAYDRWLKNYELVELPLRKATLARALKLPPADAGDAAAGAAVP